MAADNGLVQKILDAVPQQHPFRFIDDITEIDENGITGTYRFRPDESFYAGHFPGQPITPGVILIESMAQVSVVAFGIYQLMLQGDAGKMKDLVTLFSMVEGVEFLKPVYPGDKVIIRGEKVYFRKSNLKVSASMEKEDGTEVCRGILLGVGARIG